MKDKYSLLISLLLLVALLLFTSCDLGDGGTPDDDNDDNYEQNDTMAWAYDLSSDEQIWLSTIDGLGIQANEDWYQIDVTSGQERVCVELLFTHADGDIDLALVDASNKTLAVSTSSTDDEHIDYVVSASGTYYIRVYFANAGNTYDMWWDDLLVDDNYEPNDTMASAYDLYGLGFDWLSTLDGLGIQADEDWYQIHTGGYSLNVRLRFRHADGDIDLALYNASGTLLANSVSKTDNEDITYLAGTTSTCYIRVYNGNAGNTYDMSFICFPEP